MKSKLYIKRGICLLLAVTISVCSPLGSHMSDLAYVNAMTLESAEDSALSDTESDNATEDIESMEETSNSMLKPVVVDVPLPADDTDTVSNESELDFEPAVEVTDEPVTIEETQEINYDDLVETQSVTAGGIALFLFLASLYGVSYLGKSETLKQEMYDKFTSSAASDVVGVFTDYESTKKAIITQSVTSAVGSFLKSEFSTLNSGSHSYVTGVTTEYVGELFYSSLSHMQEVFLNLGFSNILSSENPYYVAWNYSKQPDRLYFTCLSKDLVPSGTNLGLTNYVYWDYNTGSYYIVSYDNFGNYIKSNYLFKLFKYYFCVGSDDDILYKPSHENGWAVSGLGNAKKVTTNLPIIISKLSPYDESLSTVLSDSSTIYYPSEAKQFASWGRYNQSNIDNIIDKQVTSEVVDSVNNSVTNVITVNSTTNDNGDVVYSDEIASIVATAVAKALLDAGVVEGAGSTDKDESGVETGGALNILDFLMNGYWTLLKSNLTSFGFGRAIDAILNFETGLDLINSAISNLGKYDIDIWDTQKSILENLLSIDLVIAGVLDSFGFRGLSTSIDVISGALTAIGEWDITSGLTDVSDKLTSIGDVVIDLSDNIAGGGTLDLAGILSSLADILTAILTLPADIANAIIAMLTDVLKVIFIPDTAVIEDTVADLRDEFSFADTLITIWEDIMFRLNNADKAPTIYIHFENSEESKYKPLGTMKAIDFAWYERYKPYGDAIISSILWAFFLLRLIKDIPNIIRGLSDGSVNSDSADNDSASKNSLLTRIGMK